MFQTDRELERELVVCRGLSDRCVFVIGYARSRTTITAQLINVDERALILTEAEFHRGGRPSFRQWYNRKHRIFDNQVCKSSYAPDFTGRRRARWWQWLAQAAEHHEVVGDKLALSAEHFLAWPAEELMSFYESRFFRARYLFTIRQPVETLLSVCRKFGASDETYLRLHVFGWLEFIKLWADMVRTLPHTVTLIGDGIGADYVQSVRDFIGLDLPGAEVLIDSKEQRKHALPESGCRTLREAQPTLDAVFAGVRRACEAPRAVLQADQKRTLSGNDSVGDGSADIAVVPQAIGQVWAMADDYQRRVLRSDAESFGPRRRLQLLRRWLGRP